MQYLSWHYWGNDIDDSDDDRDQQLPFKTANFHIVQVSFVPSASRPVLLRQQEAQLARKVYPLQDEFNLPNPALSSLFRPPQA